MKSAEWLSDGSQVENLADRAHDLGEVTTTLAKYSEMVSNSLSLTFFIIFYE